jgi:hypothetical protein
MAFSLSEALYEWLHKRRIVSEVAQEMGVKVVTLSAELRPTNPQAKLGVEELRPLFAAIRRIGYGKELEGILHHFVESLRETDSEAVPDEDMFSNAVILAKSMGMLFDCADRVSTMRDEAELVKLSTMLRTEVLPAVLQMEKMVQKRLKVVQGDADGYGISVHLDLIGNPALNL